MSIQTTAATRIRGKEREELAQALRRRVSGEVRFDAFSRVLYSTDASIYQMEPVGVVIPRDLEDVLAVVEIARESNVPVLPRAISTTDCTSSIPWLFDKERPIFIAGPRGRWVERWQVTTLRSAKV